MTHILWYVTRATGIVALVLMSGTIMLGIVGTARAASQRWPRVVTAGLHRNLALTSTALIGVHIATTVLDPFASIGLVAAVIPFSSDYRPLWLSMGTVAFDLLLAVVITSLLRDRLNHRAWQVTHLLVYLSWPVALWHALGTGTDTKLPWVLGIDLACILGIGWAVWWRLRLTESPLTRAAGLLTLGLLPLLTLIFVFLGPLRPGWAERAGTPAALLGQQIAPTPSPSGSSGPRAPSLSGTRFAGRLIVRKGPGANERTITITGHTTGDPEMPLSVIMHGTPSGRGIALLSGRTIIGRPGSPSRLAGPVIALAGHRLDARVSGPSGRMQAQFTLTIHGRSVTGTITLVADSGE